MTNIKKIAITTAITFIATTAFAATGTTVSTNSGTTASTTSTSSLELKSAPVLKSKTSSSVTLEWEKVEAAATYIVKYSKKSVATSTDTVAQYDNETDPVTSTGTTIEKLEPATIYYFSVVAVDKNNDESDTYSDELSVSTDAAGTVSASGVTATATTGLVLVNASAQDNKTIILEFSAPLNSEPVTVKITKTSDNSDVPTESVSQDTTTPNKANVKVATVLDPKSSYSVTIITAKDASGNNIQEGVNGIKEFQTLETLATAPELSAMNSASGAIVGSGAMTASGAQDLSQAPALPSTGTKENLIILASLLLSLGLVYTYRKRFAK